MIPFSRLYEEIIINNHYSLCDFDFDVVIDVGSNMGMFATYVRYNNKDCKIICYEPQKNLSDYLNIIFKYDNNVTIINKPVWDGGLVKPKTPPITLKFDAWAHSNNKSIVSFRKGGCAGKKYQSITFNDVIKDIDPIKNKVLLKVDAEGCERFLFEDSKVIEFIKKTKQTCIEFHYSSKNGDPSKKYYLDKLNEHFDNYEITSEEENTFVVVLKKEKVAAMPKYFYVSIGSNCNLKCNHCDIWKLNSKNIPTLEDRLKYVEWFKEINPYGHVLLHGGEPLIFKNEVYEILKKTKDCGLGFHLVTNGTLINDEDIKTFLDLKIDSIMISLDSHIEEIMDKMRGVMGVYKKVLSVLNKLCKYKDKIRIVSTGIITKDTYLHIKDYVDFCEKIGCVPTFNPIEPFFARNGMNTNDLKELNINIKLEDLNVLKDNLYYYMSKFPNTINEKRINNIIDYFLKIETNSSYFDNTCADDVLILDNNFRRCFNYRENRKIDNFNDLKNYCEDINVNNRIKKCSKYCAISSCNNKYSRDLIL